MTWGLGLFESKKANENKAIATFSVLGLLLASRASGRVRGAAIAVTAVLATVSAILVNRTPGDDKGDGKRDDAAASAEPAHPDERSGGLSPIPEGDERDGTPEVVHVLNAENEGLRFT
ncbi:MAG: hypothetical protein P1U34_12095 [Coxiellaceae bacterium]|nr:hypothetical protein [Coxiellaceae bacterium]